MKRAWVAGAVAAWAMGCMAVQAQVGEGYWRPYHPAITVQERGAGARYAKVDGIESFTISGNDERCEARVQDDYRTGVRQFEGYVRIRAGSGGTSGNAGPSAGACIHQVFKFLMIVVYNLEGGRLHQHSQMNLQTRQVYGRWVRINTIHDVGRRRAEVWIDGERKLTFAAGTSGGPNGFYHKYGVYNGSASNPFIEWRDVRYWTQVSVPDSGVSSAIWNGWGNPSHRGREGIGEALPAFDMTGRSLPVTGLRRGPRLFVQAVEPAQGKDP